MRTKIAKIPVTVWEDNKKIAEKFGFINATKGFEISNKILKGEVQIQKRKRTNGKTVWELSFGEN